MIIYKNIEENQIRVFKNLRLYLFQATAPGKVVFRGALNKIDGAFGHYVNSDYLNTYHISYYARRPDESETANLRKNSGFNLVLEGEAGIPYRSEDIHKLTLIKNNNRILMYVDERKIIDWVDDGKKYGHVLSDGRLGLRQMAPAYFSYRNLRVWELEGK